ncbi:hypothetical protein [Streptomyces sp. NPDC093149]|uniref:hypothetical protein n=1 Tax=Streptomyces sp. NPDC093149 TaxID=3366031 RepID=UPI0038185069
MSTKLYNGLCLVDPRTFCPTLSARSRSASRSVYEDGTGGSKPRRPQPISSSTTTEDLREKATDVDDEEI